MCVAGDHTFDVSGIDGNDHLSKAEDGVNAGEDGMPGKHGIPGESGGNILVCSSAISGVN